MKATIHPASRSSNKPRLERRKLVCEICGERLLIDWESGERHCPLCEETE